MQDIGKNIKEIRLSKKMKIIDVARKANLSASLISQIENNKAKMSLLSLTKIADALEIPPGSFFGKQDLEVEKNNNSTTKTEEKSFFIVKKGKNKIMSPSKGITYLLLTPNLECKVQFLFAIFEPHTKTAEKPYQHLGEEYAYILKGKLQIEFSGSKYNLREGDSIYFDPQKPHRVINHSNTRVEAIWVNSPPWF